jgi:hypothetical protein
MTGKVTLITPPDIYENSNASILFINLQEKEQDLISNWLTEYQLNVDCNFYVYNGENNISWFLWAIGCCQYKFIDLDNLNEITQSLSGYILGKNNFYYKTNNENLASIYSHISNRRVLKIEHFLEQALND